MSLQPASFPQEVVDLCRRLQQAGHAAYLVGGAVRDRLRGDPPKDFDLATSARPEQVQGVFSDLRVIPTGIAHGTVTVMTPGASSLPVEITTFRGDGTYSDGRRPDSVVFLDDVVEDLRRRDFTINAIAYDPVADKVVDPFEGQRDLGLGQVRAVGDPVARLREDGLRVLRAVRFAARFGFTIEAATWRAIPSALDVLRQVSRERVRDELQKIIQREPSLVFHGLDLLFFAKSCDILGTILPDLAPHARTLDDNQGDWIYVVSNVPVGHRWTALLWPLREHFRAQGMDRRAVGQYLYETLRLSTAHCEGLSWALTADLPTLGPEMGAVRRFLALHPNDQEGIRTWLLVGQRIEEERMSGHAFKHLATRIQDAQVKPFPLRPGELDLSGANIVSDLGIPPGPRIGELQRALHAWVLDDPTRNKRALLIEEARRLLSA